MKTLPSASLTSYQSGARATRAKTVGSLALGATALAAWPGTAEAQTIATGPGLQNHAGESYLINTLNMTTGITGSGNGSVPAGTWNLFFLSQSTGNSSENSYLTANGLNTGFGTAEVAEHNNGLSGQNVLSNLSPGTIIGPGGSLSFATSANEYYYTPNHGAPGLKTPEWVNVNGTFGVKIAEADGNHYGWVSLTTTNGGANITIDSLALNSVPDVGIAAGGAAIPEPASAALLLAAGAGGLTLYRQRKNLRRAT